MSDQCALGPDGKLLDASKIVFYNDPDDITPLPPVLPSNNGHARDSGRPGRARNNTRMQQILQAEKEDDNGNLPVKSQSRRANTTVIITTTKKKLPSTSTPLDNTDVEDDDFISGQEDVELDSEDSEDDVRIGNEEVAAVLLSKTIPLTAAGSTTRRTQAEKTKTKKRKATNSLQTGSSTLKKARHGLVDEEKVNEEKVDEEKVDEETVSEKTASPT